MIFGALYAAALVALFVRVRVTDDFPPDPARPLPGEPLWLTRLHHGLFYGLLLGAPIERAIVSGASEDRALGAALFALGVLVYRLAGGTLGNAVSPFIEPRAGAPLVTRGLYRHVRHPMYVGEALIAVGAPLTLGCRVVLWLAAPALLVLFARAWLEEEALVRTFPEYARYAARTKRIVPFVF